MTKVVLFALTSIRALLKHLLKKESFHFLIPEIYNSYRRKLINLKNWKFLQNQKIWVLMSNLFLLASSWKSQVVVSDCWLCLTIRANMFIQRWQPPCHVKLSYGVFQFSSMWLNWLFQKLLRNTIGKRLSSIFSYHNAIQGNASLFTFSHGNAWLIGIFTRTNFKSFWWFYHWKISNNNGRWSFCWW